MKVTLTRITDDPIGAIDEAAANCYNTDITAEDYEKGKLMRGCLKSGHHAVTEFAHLTFHIEGVSRALTHQLVRHRLASFAQRSQRYCSEDGFDYVIPKSIDKNDMAAYGYINIMDDIQRAYKKLQSLGIPNEDARMILPNACCTAIEVSMDFREFMHFCNERLCTRAQWEIRELAQAMVKEVEKVAPELAKFCVPKCEAHSPYCFCTEAKSCGRHPKIKDIFEKDENF